MIAGVRQFKLINALGREYDMTRPDALLHAPNGLGWGTERTVNRLGMTYIGINEKEIHQSPSGEMVFRTYEEYGSFLSFCQQGGLVLCYKPLETWYYCECLISIQKSEIQWENNHLICPVQFTLLSYWYEKVVAQTAEPAEPSYRTVTGDPAVFNARYSYPIRDLSVAIQGSQELNGYDKPWVGGAGKNKFNGANGFWSSSNGTWTDTGTATFYMSCAKLGGTSGTQYHISTSNNFNAIYVVYWNNGTYVSYDYYSVNTKEYNITLSTRLTYTEFAVDLRFDNQASATGSTIMMSLGSTATEYEPYENIASITAYTGRTITQQGKNLINPLKVYNGIAYNAALGQVLSIAETAETMGQNDNIFTYQTTATWQQKGWLADIEGMRGNLKFTALFNSTGTGGISAYLLDNAYTVLDRRVSNSVPNNVNINFDLSAYETAKYFVFGFTNRGTAATTLTLTSPQLEAGDTATEYEPYQHAETAVSWETEAGEVYKGTLNINTGELVVEWAVISSYNGETLPSEWISSGDEYVAGTTPTTGQTVAYKLATPLTYQLTPTQLNNLIGQNTIQADAGAVTVTYRTDARTEYKVYPYQYSYTYGDTAQNVFDISCDLPSYFKLTIFGEATNPTYRVVVNGSVVKSGKINATIGSSQKLVINTDPKNTEIALYTLSNTRINNLYGYSDFATERIFALPQGECQVQVLTEDEQLPKVMIEVLKHV